MSKDTKMAGTILRRAEVGLACAEHSLLDTVIARRSLLSSGLYALQI
jgi:hypothetical protein